MELEHVMGENHVAVQDKKAVLQKKRSLIKAEKDENKPAGCRVILGLVLRWCPVSTGMSGCLVCL